jgi:cytochrome c oxidase subunit I+III
MSDSPTAESIRKEEQSDLVARREMLHRTWAGMPGFYGWLTDTNHKSVAMKYIVTAFLMFALGGIEALAIRLQLARPDSKVLTPDLYNQFFSVHGSTMMFLFAVPLVLAFGIYFVPIMVGTRNVPFPRLNLYGYFVYLAGCLFLYVGFALNIGVDTGWFSYVPLAGPDYSPGKRVDIWAQMITFTEISALIAAIQIIVTALKMRAPGMTLNRVPLFVWAMVVTSFMVIFAMPSIMVASIFLPMERLISTHFFNQVEGGDPLLWQHLFWFFGHPEVYIIFIPALGMMSNLIIVFSRRKIVGHAALVLSLIATAFIAFGLWVHHMFATGLPQLGMSYFTAASMIISIPSGIQIFCWVATLVTGRLRWDTPLYYVFGFFAVFIIGGMTGVMTASVPLDWQIHDTYFIVAHLHYVLIGGSVFPILGSIHYWWPNWTGRMLSEPLGKISFWFVFAGFNLTFFPMHNLGLHGMPRRIYTYSAESGWGPLNMLATIGVFVLTIGLLTFLANILESLSKPMHAEDNPWEADTLEWLATSPIPPYNFMHIPVVEGRYPLWDRSDPMPVVTGLSHSCRESLVTTVRDAEPDHRMEHPSHSIWPLLMAVATGVTIMPSIFTPWAFVFGGVLHLLAGIGWFWPKSETGVA